MIPTAWPPAALQSFLDMTRWILHRVMTSIPTLRFLGEQRSQDLLSFSFTPTHRQERHKTKLFPQISQINLLTVLKNVTEFFEIKQNVYNLHQDLIVQDLFYIYSNNKIFNPGIHKEIVMFSTSSYKFSLRTTLLHLLSMRSRVWTNRVWMKMNPQNLLQNRPALDGLRESW